MRGLLNNFEFYNKQIFHTHIKKINPSCIREMLRVSYEIDCAVGTKYLAAI